MKLLWRYSLDYNRQAKNPATVRLDKVTDFLDFVEKEIKSSSKSSKPQIK